MDRSFYHWNTYSLFPRRDHDFVSLRLRIYGPIPCCPLLIKLLESLPGDIGRFRLLYQQNIRVFRRILDKQDLKSASSRQGYRLGAMLF
jgi:hypothetical protein